MADHDEEKSFNDDELEDIMNEIENLEKEFDDDAVEPNLEGIVDPAPEAEAAPEPKAQDAPAPKPTPAPQNVVPIPTSGAAGETRMNFQVSGQMNLVLDFTVGGQNIQLTVNENEGLTLGLAGGATFSLPLGGKSGRKAA